MTLIISTQNHWNQPSGITSFIKHYSSELKEKTYILTRENIVKPYHLNEKEVENVKQKIKEIKPTLAHLHSPLDSSIYGGIIDLLKEQNIPIIYFCHSSIREELGEELQQEKSDHFFFHQKLLAQEELFEKSDTIIFFNNHQKKIALNDNPQWLKKSIVIYHGTKKPEQINQASEKENKQKIILYCGRFSKEKGIIDLAKAYKKIATAETKLLLVGNLRDDEITREIKNILTNTNYEIKAWTNNQQELSAIYEQAHVVVLPSHYDSFNITGIEAIARSIPLIVSDIPSFREIYLTKNLAIKFQKNNINSLAKAIQKTLLNPTKAILPEEYFFQKTLEKIEQINQTLITKS